MTSSDKVYSLSKNGWKALPALTDNGKKLSAGTDYDKNIVYVYDFVDGEVRDGASKEKVKPVIERNAGDTVQECDIIPAGSRIRMTVTGLKNYYGTLSYVYRIVSYDISKASIKVQPKVYTGKEVRLDKEDITVKLGKDIIDPSNYEIDGSSYINNIDKGKATVTIKGVNDLGSSKIISFTIGQKSFLWWWRNLWQ